MTTLVGLLSNKVLYKENIAGDKRNICASGVHAGGPGSGCKGENCGRPKGHSGPHREMLRDPKYPNGDLNWAKIRQEVHPTSKKRPSALDREEDRNRAKHQRGIAREEHKSRRGSMSDPRGLDKDIADVQKHIVKNMGQAARRNGYKPTGSAAPPNGIVQYTRKGGHMLEVEPKTGAWWHGSPTRGVTKGKGYDSLSQHLAKEHGTKHVAKIYRG